MDIGIGQALATMKPKEIEALKRCKEPTLFFERSGNGLAETLYAGMTMRTEYPRVTLSRQHSITTIQFYAGGSSQAAETLQLVKDGTVLVVQTRGFRSRTFLRCNAPQRKNR
ncbi:MAG TPA: hypothetical protein VGG69_12385 [Rhizomicrobium sp.]